MKKTNQEWAKKLKPLADEALRNVSGDFDWELHKLRAIVNSTRELCNAVNGFILEQTTGGFIVHERVRVKVTGGEGRVTAPWYLGGVWVDDLGPYAPDELERLT